MNALDEHAVHCPFCDAPLTLLVDPSAGNQRYTEDCHVCCQPMEVCVSEDIDGEHTVTVDQE